MLRVFSKTRISILICLICISQQLSYTQDKGGADTSKTKEGNIDLKLFRVINNGRNGFSDAVIPLTDKSVLPISVLLPTSILSISRINENYYDENSGVLLLLSELTSIGITFGTKQILRRERPFFTHKNVYHSKYNSPTDRYSFPSGHTATSFSIATSLTLRYPDKPIIIALSYLYAAVTGYGRIYLGVHYPSDILGGMLIGSGSAALIYSIRKEIINFKNNLFHESNKRDSNIQELSAPVILGLTLGIDIINNLIQTTKLRGKVTFTSHNDKLSAKISF